MTPFKLTQGALATIMTGGNIDEPIMQVLGNKKIVGNADKERYRLLVSDGQYQISFAMIATQINDKITSGELGTNAIIKIKKYITSMINSGGKGDRRVLVILELEILTRGDIVGSCIGSPQVLPDDPVKLEQIKKSLNGSNGTSFSNNSSSSSVKPTFKPVAKPPTHSVTPAAMETSSMDGTMTVPISNISPYQNKWVIKARVTNKSSIRTWSNSRGEGKLFSVDLTDESGEIRATVFRDLVDKFYPVIEIDKVYYINKCQVKTANKKFSNIDNEYELTFTGETTVTPCYDEASIPKAMYNFVTIDKVANCNTGDIIDVLGICKSVGDVQTITIRSTNRELKKREVTLVDETNTSVVLTLWGNEAETFSIDDGGSPLLAIRGAKVGEFGGGKNLSVLVSSIVKRDPDIPEAHRLLGWYENEGKNVDANNISARTGAGNMKTDWLNISDVKDRKLGSGAQADYYQCKATILLVNSGNALYKACPADDCNKKVIDMDGGQYRCEKCCKEYDRFKYRIIMSMNIGDWSDNQWVSMFAGEAEKILGMTSQELGESTETDKDALAAICNRANFSEFIFRCRAKVESYNDESRLKSVAIKVDPINYKDYHEHLLTELNTILGL